LAARLISVVVLDMSNRLFILFVLILLGIGLWLGRTLSFRSSLSIPSILNVIGIVYSITAVVVLYEAISANISRRSFIVNYFAPFILWAHTLVPLGVAIAWVIPGGGPSRNIISSFGLSFFVYSILPLGFLDTAVTFPRIKEWQPVDIRFKRFGLFLLVSGLSMQLIAACLAV
jgi:hypothetical protein